LQNFVDLLVFGGTVEDFVSKGYSKDYVHSFMAVLQQAFRFTVFLKKFITFNPMQYVVQKKKTDNVDLFAEEDTDCKDTTPLTHEQYLSLMEYLEKKNQPGILPIQIAYFTGLRLGEVCELAWQNINLEEQYLTVRRSIRYNSARHKTEIGPTKRKKVRIVDFCDTLADILRKAKKEQHKQRFQYGELYYRNYYKEVQEKNRAHYELYHLAGTENIPLDYNEISLVCIRPDGAYKSPSTLGIVCRTAKAKLPGFENFHFHALRHTYTTNLLSNGALPKDVQELLGHSDVSTTMNVYAHATREAKRNSAKLLDKVVGLN
jgi:integrase